MYWRKWSGPESSQGSDRINWGEHDATYVCIIYTVMIDYM